MRPALDVANHFIEYSGYTKTSLQIQNLTYVAHGYMLGIHGKRLVFDQAEAWNHGPVFPNIFHEFKEWGLAPIRAIRYGPEPFTEQERDVLDNVYAYYGQFCGSFIYDMAQDNSDNLAPWQRCYVSKTKYACIPDSVTEAYYQRLYQQHGYEY